MTLFGPMHWSLLLATAGLAILFCYGCRKGGLSKVAVRMPFGMGLMLNEFGWWWFRYSHEGLRISNLPLRLCDVSLWATIAACLLLTPVVVEFAYFAGIAGVGMALLTPDLWSPWPTYPALCFFIAHGGIVIANLVVIYGGIAASSDWSVVARLRNAGPLRAQRRHLQRGIQDQLCVFVQQARKSESIEHLWPVAALSGGCFRILAGSLYGALAAFARPGL